MARIVDNLIAYRILSMLVTPFEETDAYKLGIIDKDGHNLIKPSKLTTSEQKDAYSYLTRLVFNIKKIINKLPGSDSRIRNLIAAFWLVKESYENTQALVLREDVIKLIRLLDTVTLVEEELVVKTFLENKELDEDGEGGAPTNSTGPLVSTDIPVARKKDINKYKKNNAGLISMARRNNKVM